MIAYEPATYCTYKDQVGLIRLRDYWMATGDVLINNGINNCRNVRGGTSLSTHAEGRAWDAVWKTNEALQAAIGFMLHNAEALQCQEIIDYRGGRRWSSNHGWQTYSEYGAAGWSSHFARNWAGALDTRTIEEIVEVDIVTPEDINAIALKTAATVEAVLEPVVHKVVQQEIANAFWGDDPKGTTERVPSGLIRRLRQWLRTQPA